MSNRTLKGQHIFILGTAKFDGNIQSTSFNVARELSRDNHVWYIDYPFTWKDCLAPKNFPQLKTRISHFLPGSDGIIKTSNPRLNILIVPPLASLNFLAEGKFYRSLLSINEKIIRGRIAGILKKHRIAEFIYINSFNFHYPGVADKLKPALTVYHCVDPMIIPYDMKHGIVSEEELVRKSDVVLCTSRQLEREKKAQNVNTYFVGNAAHADTVLRSGDPNTQVHPILKTISKTMIGYAGAIERRLDYQLIRDVANLHPDKIFVFAGPVSGEFVPQWFFDIENVILPGSVPFEEIPSLIKGFDLTILPFKSDSVSATIFPLKLFEYLGAGKPVVSTCFNPDLAEFTGDTVRFCQNAEEFAAAITDELASANADVRRKRVDVAKNNTWEIRGCEISAILKTNLENKTAVMPA